MEPTREPRRLIDVRIGSRIVLIALAGLVSGCGLEMERADLPQTTTTAVEPGRATTVPVESGDDVKWRSGDPVETWVIADLVERLDVPAEEIAVESVESGVWADGSLGCPDPDGVYTQALVPGKRVRISHEDATYEYHQGGSGDPFLCETPVEEAFTGVEGDVLIPPPGYDD